MKPFIPDFVFTGESNLLNRLFERLYNNNFSSFVHLDLASGLVYILNNKVILYDSLILCTIKEELTEIILLFIIILIKYFIH